VQTTLTKPATVLDVTDSAFSNDLAVQSLRERGFVILRNVFAPNAIESVVASTKIWLARPAIAGAPGYAKVDHAKKLLNAFVLGDRVIELLVSERVLDIVEATMDSEAILAEAFLKWDGPTSYVYFPIHSDFSAGWRKAKSSNFVLNAEEMTKVIGIGGVLYLHDAADGAFIYCEGSHRLMSPHGQNLAKYSKSERETILSRRVRCDGKKGDLVLFDDRGFHGPDQPSLTSRLAILLDYYRVATFGRTQVTPMPIWSSDLGRMNQRQLRAAGQGATYMTPPMAYTHTRFMANPLYRVLTKLTELSYFHRHAAATLRAAIRRRSK
jgi:hypothetical protein